MDKGSQPARHVTGSVRLLLRLEGLALFALGAGLCFASGAAWWLFALLFFAPDLAFVAYVPGPRVGAAAYNAPHSLIGPVALGAIALHLAATLLVVSLALIWLAHAGFDRALGYGLKYTSGFSDTHLGGIGRSPAQ